MGYSRDETWEKGDGFCSLCGRKLVQKNGMYRKRSAWQADHSNPKSRGGTDNIRNMNPICTKCNNKRSNHDRSLAETRRRTEAVSPGGKIIDTVNKFKNNDSLIGGLPDLPDGFAGASRKRRWKQ